ncbi:MAG: Tfp pilus assembly protein FimT/FimU [Vicinamibacterales bacterium]
MAVSSARGLALVDVLAATALSVLVSATAIPVVAGAMEHERATAGAHYLATRLKQAQLEALRRGTSVAVRFGADGEAADIQMFADGNGNGVLVRDIEQGIDRPLSPPDRLGTHARGVTLRVNQPVPDVGGNGTLDTGSDPIRIGRTALLSFSPTGSATAGTVYVAAARGPQFAVRIMGSTGRMRVLRFDAGAGAWQP